MQVGECKSTSTKDLSQLSKNRGGGKLQGWFKVLSPLELIYLQYYWRYIFKNSFYSFEKTRKLWIIFLSFLMCSWKLVFFSEGGGCVSVLLGEGGRVWTVIQVNYSMFNDTISILQILEITDLPLSFSLDLRTHCKN